jgi:hypothetical protein
MAPPAPQRMGTVIMTNMEQGLRHVQQWLTEQGHKLSMYALKFHPVAHIIIHSNCDDAEMGDSDSVCYLALQTHIITYYGSRYVLTLKGTYLF